MSNHDSSISILSNSPMILRSKGHVVGKSSWKAGEVENFFPAKNFPTSRSL